MKNPILDLEPKLLWKYFYQMTQVPRPSKKEEKIRAWVRKFAETNSFEYQEDAVGNIVIKVSATEGYENLETIVLQGHTDMVCEKNNDTVHDFDNDPLTVFIDGDWVTAKGTTLGADNGIGVAAGMAIATDPNAKHGPLELLMTIDEETGMTGANELQPGFITGKTLFNLDSEEDGAFYVGCSGGVDTVGKIFLNFEENKTDYKAVKIVITNFMGGHSGLDIHRGRANAIKVLGQLMFRLKSIEHKLVSINGGSLRNAIPREAEILALFPTEEIDKVKSIANQFVLDVRIEYKNKDAEVNVLVNNVDEKVEKYISEKDSSKIVRLINSLPHGVIAMSADLEGLVETSTNLATIRTNEDSVIIGTSQRSSVEFSKVNIAATVASVFELANAEVKTGDGYPGWQPNVDSRTLKIGKEVFEKQYGKQPEIKAIHAGLECGILSSKYPGLDMISFGPTIEGAHSPHERVNIKDVAKFYNLLKNMLISI